MRHTKRNQHSKHILSNRVKATKICYEVIIHLSRRSRSISIIEQRMQQPIKAQLAFSFSLYQIDLSPLQFNANFPFPLIFCKPLIHMPLEQTLILSKENRLKNLWPEGFSKSQKAAHTHHSRYVSVSCLLTIIYLSNW